MSITYAGIPFLLEDVDGRVIDYANQYLATEDLRCFGVDPPAIKNNHLPLCYPNYSDGLRPKINTLYWPTGASRWACGYFLADDATLRAINEAIALESLGLLPGTLRMASNWNYGLPALDIVPGSAAEAWLSMIGGITVPLFMLPPRPLSGIDLGTGNGAWIVPLVDKRYFWQFVSLYPDTTSWTTLFNDIKTALGETDTASETYTNQGVPDPCTFGSRPSENGPYFNAATMLDALAHTLGRRVNTIPQGATQTIALDTYTAAAAIRAAFLAIVDAFGARIAGNVFSPANSLGVNLSQWIVPETLRIVFPRWEDDGFVDANAHEEDRSASDNGFSLLGSRIGSVHYLNTAAAADFSGGGGAPDNATAVTNLADQIADDFYGWMSQRHDFTVPGILPWIPNGFDDYAEWSFQRMPNGCYQGQTRVHSAPYNFGIDRTLHQFSGFDDCTNEPSVEQVVGGRLTINPQVDSAGRKIEAADTSATPGTDKLYYVSWEHHDIALWNGSAWKIHTIPFDSGLTNTIQATLPSTNTVDIWDVFIHDDGGTLTLTFDEWSSDSNPGGRARQNGVIVASGDATKRYLGTIAARSDGSSTSVHDHPKARLVFNFYNRVPLPLRANIPEYTMTADITTRDHNNGSAGGAERLQFVSGMADLTGNFGATTSLRATGTALPTIGIDVIRTEGDTFPSVNVKSTQYSMLTAGELQPVTLQDILSRNAGVDRMGVSTVYLTEAATAGTGTLTVGEANSALFGDVVM